MCLQDMIDDNAATVEANLDAYHEDFVNLVRHVETQVDDDCRAPDDDDDCEPCIMLTVATDDGAEDYGWQSGDNSFMGGAYHFPHWAVVYVMRDCDPFVIANDICEQLAELILS